MLHVCFYRTVISYKQTSTIILTLHKHQTFQLFIKQNVLTYTKCSSQDTRPKGLSHQACNNASNINGISQFITSNYLLLLCMPWITASKWPPYTQLFTPSLSHYDSLHLIKIIRALITHRQKWRGDNRYTLKNACQHALQDLMCYARLQMD